MYEGSIKFDLLEGESLGDQAARNIAEIGRLARFANPRASLKETQVEISNPDGTLRTYILYRTPGHQAYRLETRRDDSSDKLGSGFDKLLYRGAYMDGTSQVPAAVLSTGESQVELRPDDGFLAFVIDTGVMVTELQRRERATNQIGEIAIRQDNGEA